MDPPLGNGFLRYKDNLAGSAWLENFLVRAGGFGQRHLFADDWAQRAVGEASDQAGMDLGFLRRCDAPECERTDRGVAAHEFARVDGDFTAIANDDDAAARC